MQASLGEANLTFFDKISTLANKFEPFDGFTTEQVKFVLNKCTQKENRDKLVGQLSELAITCV